MIKHQKIKALQYCIFWALVTAGSLFYSVGIFSASANNIARSDQGAAEAQQNQPDKKRLWNLDNVDILALIGEISRLTGRNFIIDPRVSGKASLVSNKPIDDMEAYRVFLSILQVLGFAAVDNGEVVKIVPVAVAKQLDTKVVHGDLSSLGDEMVVQVIAVKHIAVSALVPILRSMANPQGQLASYGPSNVIVIADSASNVTRMVEIIRRIDQEGSDEIEVVPLKDASADELVRTLANLSRLQQGESAAQLPKMAADLRTNSILLGGDKTKRVKLRALIAQMDVPTPHNGNTEVVFLQYQNAESLVGVLSSVISAYYGKEDSGSGGYNSNVGRQAPLAATPQAAAAYAGTGSGTGSGSADSFGGATDTRTSKRSQESSASAPGVRAEPNTNALVITAPPELMRNLKAVIARLDIRRPQILVEAAIVEVSLNQTQDLGIEWRLGNHGNGIAGGTSYADPFSKAATQGLIDTSAPYLSHLPSNGLSVGFIRGGNLRAVIHTLTQDTNTNIISTPSLVAMDNETALITVADDIPYQKLTQVSPEGTQLNTAYDYKSVGFTLKMTPMITRGDAVRLTIDQTVGSLKSPGLTPTTTNRIIKTAVVVNDSDILVLGGLITGQHDEGISKVPFLGDIPLFGRLFQRTTHAMSKRNLMVFIRPVILRDNQDSVNVSMNKYDLMRDTEFLGRVDPFGAIAPHAPLALPAVVKDQIDQKLALPEPFALR
jgi:general secretion pathway protein D